MEYYNLQVSIRRTYCPCRSIIGIASLLLPREKIVRPVFKIPLQPDEMLVCYFDKRPERADLICETKLIVWDGVPMMNRLAFEVVDHHLKDICDN